MDESKLLYAASHEWADVQGEACTVGITRFAVEQLTDIVYIELPQVGKRLKPGDVFGVIESVKAVSDLYSPLAGEVVEVNAKVVDDPALLSADPYDGGWLIRLRLDGKPDVSTLLAKADYDKKCADEAH
jgi:glycine cleavage system H protein